MKINPKIVAAIAVIMLCLVSIVSFFFLIPSKPSEPVPNTESTAELSGYYKGSDGIMDAATKIVIASGEFTEAVATKEHLLTMDKQGTLTLIRVADKKTIKIDDPQHAYQLKVIGDDFGYLKEHGTAQYITFLDPETGKSKPMKTEHNVITWDAAGNDITYHLYDTPIIGFARYNNQLGWVENAELDADIQTVGQMFSKNGKNYVWAVADETQNVIYSADTRKIVTSEFPVIEKIEQVEGTLSEIVGGYWILTAPLQGSSEMFSQVWNGNGEPVLNMTITGYSFNGDATEGNNSIYFPVSYTSGSTPDGLLIMNLDDQSTDFEDGAQSYIGE